MSAKLWDRSHVVWHFCYCSQHNSKKMRKEGGHSLHETLLQLALISAIRKVSALKQARRRVIPCSFINRLVEIGCGIQGVGVFSGVRCCILCLVRIRSGNEYWNADQKEHRWLVQCEFRR